MRRAGFVILGKTNTPEFGSRSTTESPAYPTARNPWDTDRTPGGSSGGAGAALAAGLVRDRPRIRRRRFDPHPVGMVRSGRAEAVARARVVGPRSAERERDERTAGPHRRRRRRVPRRHRGLRVRRLLVGAAAGASVPRRGRTRAGPAPDRVHHAPPRTRPRPSPTRGATRCSRPRAGSKRSATTSSKPSRRPSTSRPPRSSRRRRAPPIPTSRRSTPSTSPTAPSCSSPTLTTAKDLAAAEAELQLATRRYVAFFGDYDVLLTPTLASGPPLHRREHHGRRRLGRDARAVAHRRLHPHREHDRPTGDRAADRARRRRPPGVDPARRPPRRRGHDPPGRRAARSGDTRRSPRPPGSRA